VEADVTGLVSDLAGKASTVHTHVQGDVTGLTASLAGKSDTGHTHTESDVTGLTTDLAAKVAKSTLTTKGDIYVATGSATPVRLGVGTDGQVLVADSGQASGVKWDSTSGGGGFAGAWDSGTAYAIGDMVTKDGWLVAAKTAGTNQPPFTDTVLDTDTPGTVDSGDSSGYNMGVKFTVDRPILMKAVTFYKDADNTGLHTAALWAYTPTGFEFANAPVQIFTKDFSGESGSGVQSCPFEYLLLPGTYQVSVTMPNGHYSVDAAYFAAPITVGSVTFPTNAGLYSTPADQDIIPVNANGSNYWVGLTWAEPDDTNWTELARYPWQAQELTPTLMAMRQIQEQYGARDGLAPLDGNAKLPVSYLPGVVELSDGVTIATNASLGSHYRVTLGGNRTLGNPTNGTDGQKIVWELIQDGTGSRTITLDTKFALGSEISSVVLTTTAGKRDFLGAIYNQSTDKWYVVALAKGY
jgi:hypothetical protein